MKTLGKILLATAFLAGGLLVVSFFAVPPIAETWTENQLAELGIHGDVRVRLGLCWTTTGPGIEGSARVSVPDSPWKVKANFSAAPCQWHAKVNLPKTEFNEDELLVRKLLERFPVTAVSNLTFSAKIALEAAADRTFSMPVPVWSAKVRLQNADADAYSGENPLSVHGFNLTAGVSGISDHIDIDPMFPRAAAIEFAGLALTNFLASVRATERRLLVTEAGAGLCDGHARIFSLFLNTESLNSGFTIYLEDINAGKALTSFKGLNGKASGRLHGKLKMSIRNSGKIRLRDAFLYSVPGEKGHLQLSDSSAVTDNLALAGIDESQRDNVSHALSDLEYSVLRLDLSRIDDNNATLGIRLEGCAGGENLAVPVVLNLTLRGDINQLINTGLNLSGKMKGKQ